MSKGKKERIDSDYFSTLSVFTQSLNDLKQELNQLFQKEWLPLSPIEMQKKSYGEFVESFVLSSFLKDLLMILFPKEIHIFLIESSSSDKVHVFPKKRIPEEIVNEVKSYIKNWSQSLLPYKFLPLAEEKEKIFISAIPYKEEVLFLGASFVPIEKLQTEEYSSPFWVSLSSILSEFVLSQIYNWENFLSERYRKINFSISFEEDVKTNFRSLNIQNLRAFEDTGGIELRPITILIGLNSSGKSSIAKTLLMLKHTQESNQRDQILTTDHPYSDFGNPSNFVHKQDLERPIRIGIEYQNRNQPACVLLLEFKIIIQGENLKEKQNLMLENLTWREVEGKNNLILTKTSEKIDTYKVELSYFKKGERQLKKIKEDINFSGTTNLFTVLNSLPAFLDIPSIFPNFSSLHFISSFRPLPTRSYDMRYSKNYSLDYDGSNLVELIASNEKLIEKVSFWLKILGMGRGLEIRGFRNVAKLNIKTFHDMELELSDVGFGISHILPILTLGFMDKHQEGTLLVENPELHLHPKAQGDLAELFCEIIKGKKEKKLLIETHSEHLISRFQTLVAEEKLDPDEIIIYFCQPQGEGGSKVLEIEMDEEGSFKQPFPEGFFEVGFKESMRRIEAISKKEKNKTVREKK